MCTSTCSSIKRPARGCAVLDLRARPVHGCSPSTSGRAHTALCSAQPHRQLLLACITLAGAAAGPALALGLQPEPANALSLPTWAVHVSSVAEWITGMGLMWTFAEASGREYWKGMSWAMLPSLAAAMCACTWHLFYNAEELEWLVALQAALTVVGNVALWAGALHVLRRAEQSPEAAP